MYLADVQYDLRFDLGALVCGTILCIGLECLTVDIAEYDLVTYLTSSLPLSSREQLHARMYMRCPEYLVFPGFRPGVPPTQRPDHLCNGLECLTVAIAAKSW